MNCKTSSATWNKIQQEFYVCSTTRVMHFHCQLRAQKRRDQPMRDYLDGIQSICDSLASCSCHVDEIMQISTIIVGLPVKYEHVIIVISANRPPSDLQTVCCILLDAEGRQ